MAKKKQSPPKTPLKVALAAASAPTLERMDEDAEDVPSGLEMLVRHIRANLLKNSLDVTTAKQAVGIGDNSVTKAFSDCLCVTPAPYIHIGRAEIAEPLLRDHGFSVTVVARAVGYTNATTFSRNYQALTGERPSEVRGERSEPFADVRTWYRALRGQLEDEESEQILELLLGFYSGDKVLAPSLLDGPRFERWQAEALWEEIRQLPFEQQKMHVACYLFRTTALFDYLRQQSRLEGRNDRQLGVRLAELALISVESCGEAWTDRIYDRRAEGLICLGNARRLAADFPRSNAEFEAAWAVWRAPRERRDPRIPARIHLNQGTLRMFQRRYDEALQMVDKALTLYEREGDTEGQILALIQRAAIRGYTDHIEESIRDLQTALNLTDRDEAPYLVFTIYKNLTNTYLRAGSYGLAWQNIVLSLESRPGEDCPLGKAKVAWLKGCAKEGMGEPEEAESLYCEARTLYIEAEDSTSTALLGLDIAAFYSENGRHAEVMDLISKALPVLGSLRFHDETLAALALLSQAARSGEVSSSLLRRVIRCMARDPLHQLA